MGKHLILAALLTVGLGLAACQKNTYRKQMAALDWGTDSCFVYGHKTPDADAVCSALAYAQLMRELGYNCVAKICGTTNRETQYICGLFGFEAPAGQASVARGTRIIATDHEEYSQSVDGARESRILQIIDHHQEGDMAASGTLFIRRETVGSTCTIVWELYREAKVRMDDSVTRILLAGILSDTDNLAKTNTTQADTLALRSLAAQLHIGPDSLTVIRARMLEALSDYDGMSDYEIFVSDYKDYDMGDTAVGIGCVEWTDYATMDEFIDRMLAAAERIYGKSLRAGVCYSENRLVRKRDVTPALTGYYGQ